MTKSKQSKKPHNSTPLSSLANTRTRAEMIENYAYMLFPEKLAWRNRLIYTLWEWAADETSLDITDFAHFMNMRRQTLYEWANRYQDLREAMDEVKLLLASRKRRGALLKVYDKDVAFRDMHNYDPEWHAVNKYHADLKKEEEAKAHTFTINFEKPKVISKQDMKGITDDIV